MRGDRNARPRGGGRAAPSVVRRHPAGAARAAGQEDLQPVPSPRGHGCTRARRLRPRRRDRDRRRGPHRRRAGHVHLRGPRRRDPAARPDPLRRAAAAHDHPRRRGHRARHRVDDLPQRAAARVGPRDGRLHRRRRGGHARDPATTCSTPSPTPTARSATRPGCGSSSSRCRRTSRCATSGSTTPACSPRPIAEIVETREYDGVQVDGLDGVAFAAGGVLPHPGALDGHADGGLDEARPAAEARPAVGRRRATTPASRSTTARSSSGRPTC